MQVSDHFWSSDFDCHCIYPECRITYVDEELVTLGLEQLWHLSGELWISSGFRCTRRNEEEDGKKGSYHLVGKAADVKSKTIPRFIQAQADTLSIFRNGGIGSALTFTHLDSRGYRARWKY